MNAALEIAPPFNVAHSKNEVSALHGNFPRGECAQVRLVQSFIQAEWLMICTLRRMGQVRDAASNDAVYVSRVVHSPFSRLLGPSLYTSRIVHSLS